MLLEACVCVNNFENQLLDSTRYKENIKMWTRYIDNILVIWEGSIEVQSFVNEVNIKDKNLQLMIGSKKLNYLYLKYRLKLTRNYNSLYLGKNHILKE